VLAALATLGCLASGAAAAWTLTAGFSSFTSESWRRAEVQTRPRPVPVVALQDHTGTRLSLQDLCDEVLIVDFIYTRCTTVCRSLGAISSQLAKHLDEKAPGARVLSLSFDPDQDTPERLSNFKRAMEPAATPWRLARPVGWEGRQALLKTFGVVVIPDGYGGYDHNAGLHIVDRCKLVKVLDPEDIEGALIAVRSVVEQGSR
jgi:protein SCO1/2